MGSVPHLPRRAGLLVAVSVSWCDAGTPNLQGVGRSADPKAKIAAQGGRGRRLPPGANRWLLVRANFIATKFEGADVGNDFGGSPCACRLLPATNLSGLIIHQLLRSGRLSAGSFESKPWTDT